MLLEVLANISMIYLLAPQESATRWLSMLRRAPGRAQMIRQEEMGLNSVNWAQTDLFSSGCLDAIRTGDLQFFPIEQDTRKHQVVKTVPRALLMGQMEQLAGLLRHGSV